MIWTSTRVTVDQIRAIRDPLPVLLARVLLQVVDRLNLVVDQQRRSSDDFGGGSSLGKADTAYPAEGTAHAAGDSLIDSDEVHCAPADFGGQYIRLYVAGGCSASRAVGHRKMFADLESGCTGYIDRVTHS